MRPKMFFNKTTAKYTICRNLLNIYSSKMESNNKIYAVEKVQLKIIVEVEFLKQEKVLLNPSYRGTLFVKIDGPYLSVYFLI